ncbi:hypothetical protein [Phenylobacterium sp.]|uniref:hypothetical protein n=1 Tax=Phenylobacterium sp. TaxID=1871053 RepID=UPI00286D3164|nr:hypothetical protein [Phenylobacterium sp.]
MTRDDLIEAVREAADADPRVVALFLSGSLGAGDGDRWSDCDFVLVAAPEAHATFVEQARDWIAGICAPVLWRQVYPGVPLFLAVTQAWLRLDLTVTVPSHLNGARATWRPLFDPQGLHDRLPKHPPSRSPGPDKMVAITEEFLRSLGLLPLSIGREEFVVGVTGVGHLRAQLIALLIEGHAPPSPPGALRLSRVLDAEEIALIESLPCPAANREAVIAASMACAAAFLPRARGIAQQLGATWPEALEAAARAHIRRELGIEIPR